MNPEAERTLKEGQECLQRAIEQESIEVKTLLRYVPATRRSSRPDTGSVLCCSDCATWAARCRLAPRSFCQRAQYRYHDVWQAHNAVCTAQES